MITCYEDFGFTGKETTDQLDAILQEKLGCGFAPMKDALSQTLQKEAPLVAFGMRNIAPHGDYGAMLEDTQGMMSFLQTEAHKPENWEITTMQVGHQGHDVNINLMQFMFKNVAVDDGDVLEGHVFVSFTGVIRHTFIQSDE